MPTIASPSPRETLATTSGSSKKVVRLDDRLGALGPRVARLEDAGAHEDALGAELHHHRGVGRGGDAAGGEQHDGQLAGLGDLLDQVVGRLQLLGRDVQLVLGERLAGGGSRRGSCACA